MSSISKKIEKIEKQLGELKLLLEKKEDKVVVNRKPKNKPENINTCKTKSELKKFTIKELKQWIKETDIDIKKLSEQLKDDLVKVVWKKIKIKVVEESSSDEESSGSSDNSDSS